MSEIQDRILGHVWIVEWQSMADGSMRKVGETEVTASTDLAELMHSCPYSYFRIEVRD